MIDGFQAQAENTCVRASFKILAWVSGRMEEGEHVRPKALQYWEGQGEEKEQAKQAEKGRPERKGGNRGTLLLWLFFH